MNLGDRMKQYERNSQVYLNGNYPVIIRLDGRGFSKFTKQFKAPFDIDFVDMMNRSAIELAKEICGFKIAYLQSDEITMLFDANSQERSELWFGGRTDKILSVCSGIFSSYLSKIYIEYITKKEMEFFNVNPFSVKKMNEILERIKNLKSPAVDCRVFQIPELNENGELNNQWFEIYNAFLFRQRDAEKNAISMYAQNLFPHKLLQNTIGIEQIEMMKNKNFNYDESPNLYKYGRFIYKEKVNKGTIENPIIRTDFKMDVFKIDQNKEKFFNLIQ